MADAPTTGEAPTPIPFPAPATSSIDERDTSVGALMSCMTGHTKEIVAALLDAWDSLSRSDKRFLKRAMLASFPDAGRHARRRADEPGIWAPYDTARWALALGWQRPNTTRMRDRLVTLGILRYEADPETPGAGWLGWNLALDQWEPLQPGYNQRRYARAGAGRPRMSQEQTSVISLNTLDEKQASIISLNNSEREHQPSVISLNGKNNSNLQHSLATNVFKLITHGRLDAVPVLGAHDAEELDTERRRIPDPAIAGAATSAAASRPSADAALPVALTPEPAQADGTSHQSRLADAPETNTPRRSLAKTRTERAPRQLNAKDQYRVDLLAAIREAAGGIPPPNRERAWAGAGKFFEMGAPLEAVVACYRVELGRPTWDSRYLDLTDLLAKYPVYQRNPVGYRAAIERARKGADGGYERERAAAQAANAYRTTIAARNEPQPGLPASAYDPWKDDPSAPP